MKKSKFNVRMNVVDVRVPDGTWYVRKWTFNQESIKMGQRASIDEDGTYWLIGVFPRDIIDHYINDILTESYQLKLTGTLVRIEPFDRSYKQYEQLTGTLVRIEP